MSGKTFFIRNRGKVTGPFDLQQMKFLRERGQLARFHEISEDRQNWVQAANMTDLFAAEAAVVTLSAVPSGASKAAGAGWLYADASGKQQGPVELEALVDLRRRHAINDATLVWKEGMTEWLPFKAAHPDLPLLPSAGAGRPVQRRWLLPAGIGLLIVAGVAGVGLGWHFAFHGNSTGDGSGPGLSWRLGGSTISNLDKEKDIAGAVGFIVCGFHVVFPDGSEGDIGHITPQGKLVITIGSAFLISADGHLLTNRHVVEEIGNLKNAKLLLKKWREELQLDVTPTIWVFFEKQQYTAEILHRSDNFDLAILKITRRHTPFFKLAGSDNLPRSQRVIACGFPTDAQRPLSAGEDLQRISRQINHEKAKIASLFAARDFEYIQTDGTISRVTTEDGSTRRWIQHSASINHGNSGGPLLDDKGKVIGINTLGGGKPGERLIFYSLATPQLKDEIAKHVPGAVWE